MKRIYLDLDQCAKFDVAYMGKESSTVVRAEDLLESKFNGYDVKHREYLGSFGSGLIFISRTNDDHPGWFKVEEY